MVIGTPPSREFYEKFAAMIGLHDDRPDGLIVHTATELEDGTVQWSRCGNQPSTSRRSAARVSCPAFEGSGA